MVELMVVVLIIGILVAVALPMMLGAKTRAQDRAAQAYAKYAFSAEKVYFADTETYTSSVPALDAIEPELNYVDGDTPVASGVVYVHVHPGPNEVPTRSRANRGPASTCAKRTAAGRASPATRPAASPTPSRSATRGDRLRAPRRADPFLLTKDDLAQSDVAGRDLDAFVLTDELQRLLE